jgi:ABC-2 type transport system permease protein
MLVLARHELRLQRDDALPLLLLVLLPLAVVVFFQPALELALFAEGYVHANGSSQAVPGVAVTFSLFLVGYVGLSFFRDHGWGTWDRLRVVPAARSQILAAKMLPLILLAWAQLAILFGFGFLLFDLHANGSILALVAVAIVFAAVPVTAGVVAVVFARTLQQVNVIANLGSIVVAGLGGALVPLSLLPDWVRIMAPASPAYWAMRGFRSVLLERGGMSDAALPFVVLGAWSIVFLGLALARLRRADMPLAWA